MDRESKLIGMFSQHIANAVKSVSSIAWLIAGLLTLVYFVLVFRMIQAWASPTGLGAGFYSVMIAVLTYGLLFFLMLATLLAPAIPKAVRDTLIISCVVIPLVYAGLALVLIIYLAIFFFGFL